MNDQVLMHRMSSGCVMIRIYHLMSLVACNPWAILLDPMKGTHSNHCCLYFLSIPAALPGAVRGVLCLSVYRARSTVYRYRRGCPHWLNSAEMLYSKPLAPRTIFPPSLFPNVNTPICCTVVSQQCMSLCQSFHCHHGNHSFSLCCPMFVSTAPSIRHLLTLQKRDSLHSTWSTAVMLSHSSRVS